MANAIVHDLVLRRRCNWTQKIYAFSTHAENIPSWGTGSLDNVCTLLLTAGVRSHQGSEALKESGNY